MVRSVLQFICKHHIPASSSALSPVFAIYLYPRLSAHCFKHWLSLSFLPLLSKLPKDSRYSAQIIVFVNTVYVIAGSVGN